MINHLNRIAEEQFMNIFQAMRALFLGFCLALLVGCCTTGYAPAPKHGCRVAQSPCHTCQYRQVRMERVRPNPCAYHSGCNNQGCPSHQWESLRAPRDCFY